VAVATAYRATGLSARPVPAIPQQKVDQNGHVDERFVDMHQKFLERRQQGPIGLLFLGDSITEGWGWTPQSQAIYDRAFGRWHPADFGIGGDQTQHVLWRLDNGEVDGLKPKVVVLMIGTNNIGYPEKDIESGVRTIVADIHQRMPQAKLLLLGIFPRGTDPHDPHTAEMREKIAHVNADLAKLDDGRHTRFLDLGSHFLQPDGTLPTSLFPDQLHPNPAGYQIWADAIEPVLQQMMR
jgi:beta-glucosidase